MKKNIVFAVLLSTLVIGSVRAQDAYILVDYMKVGSLQEKEYLDLEREWKAYHQKRMDEGLIEGWQLWEKLFSGEDDSYRFITITWYSSFAQTSLNPPEDFFREFMSDEEYLDLLERTVSSRIMAKRELYHRIIEANNFADTRYIIVNRMEVAPGKESEYIDMERNIWKPLQEESISREFRSHWSVWGLFPYGENQARFTTIDGFGNYSQIGTGDANLIKIVHPEKSWEEIDKKAGEMRRIVSTEIWELIDSISTAE